MDCLCTSILICSSYSFFDEKKILFQLYLKITMELKTKYNPFMSRFYLNEYLMDTSLFNETVSFRYITNWYTKYIRIRTYSQEPKTSYVKVQRLID